MGGESLSRIAMELIVPSPHNPRTIRKDDPAVRELAQSIKGHGLLQPVVCRDTSLDGPMGYSERYELLAGRRRFEAHKLLGAETILAIVRDLSDQDAIEVTVLENLQREDLTPIEEARGVASMMAGGHSLDAIADKMGKSRSWVARRASVRHLLPELVTMAEAHDWSAVRIDMLGRLPPVTQQQMVEAFTRSDYLCDSDRDDQVAGRIADLTRTLKAMPWRNSRRRLAHMTRCRVVVPVRCAPTCNMNVNPAVPRYEPPPIRRGDHVSRNRVTVRLPGFGG